MDNNDPKNVEYWELAKEFVKASPPMAEEYADLAGITVDEFNFYTPEELQTEYSKSANLLRNHWNKYGYNRTPHNN